jgi:hypothetical protein
VSDEAVRLLKQMARDLAAIRSALIPGKPVKSEASVVPMTEVGGDAVPRQVVDGIVKRGDRYHRVTRIQGDR